MQINRRLIKEPLFFEIFQKMRLLPHVGPIRLYNMAIVLLADIGGTNSRFKLKEGDVELKSDTLETSAYGSFISICEAFLKDMPSPQLAVIGTAGAVYNNTARFVNQDWLPKECSGSDVTKEIGIEKVIFLNDFVVAGYGCLALTPDDFIELNPGVQPMAGAPKAVMGPGTGLGECFMTWNGRSYDVWPTEGGHSDFAAKTELQWKYHQYMQQKVDEEPSEFEQFKPLFGPSYELCFAGVGFHSLYFFLAQEFPHEENTQITHLIRQDRDKRAKNIMINGFTGEDPICGRAVHMWQEAMGYEAGNWIAKTLPFGGFYLIGGMFSKNADAIYDSGVFKRALNTKAPHICEIIARVPIYIVKNLDVGMSGAEYYAKKILSNN